MVRAWLVVCVWVAVADAAPDVLFKTWNTENGLPQNSVNAIVQTPDGYLWLATNDGVARFDGVRFKVFKKSDTPALPSNRITRIDADDAGRVWIFAESKDGVVVHQHGQFFRFDRDTHFGGKGLIDVWSEDMQTVLSTGDTEYVYNGAHFASRSPVGRKLTIGTDRRTSTVWLDEGDTHYEINGDSIKAHSSIGRPAITSHWLTGVVFVRMGDSIWFIHQMGNEMRLARIRGGKLEISSFGRSMLVSLAKDRNGNLWIVEGYLGMHRVDAGSIAANDMSRLKVEPVNTAQGLAADQLNMIFSDRDENLWIGGIKGLQLVNDSAIVKVLGIDSGLPSENIYAVTEDREGAIWFGAWNQHLVRLKDGKFSSIECGFVTSLYEDPDLGLLVASGGLLWRWEDDRLVRFVLEGFEPPLLQEISFIERDRTGTLWLGGLTGLIRHGAGNAKRFTVADGLPSDSVTSFLETLDGAILIGTTGGLVHVKGDEIRVFTRHEGLSAEFIRTLYQDGEGTVWIGGYDGGITRFRDGQFKQITAHDGLFSDGVFCILEDDDGWFWMNSNQGIHRARRADLNDFADGKLSSVNSISYGPQDGLLHVEGNGGKQPAGLKTADGRLWFPTAGGLAIIDPATAGRNDPPPATLIDEVSVDQKSVQQVDGGYRLEPDETALEIAYTAINFRRPDQIKFRYKMAGLDANWTEAGTRRTAYFSHLPYGDYTFLVAAANADGEWNENAAAMKIRVIPPFYRTSWFFALAALFVSAAIVSIYFYRVNQLKLANEARAQFTRQLIESQEQERSRIALELHDSLGQSLAVIRNRALLGLRSVNDHQRLVEQMAEISDASAAALEETRVIAHNLHPYQLEHLGLTMALRSLVDTVQSSTGLKLTDDIQEIRAKLSADAAINVYRVVQECLSNIIKHSNAGEASVDLHETSGRLVLRVTDNGRGFDPSGKASGLGLKGIRERASILAADLRVDTKPGNGTTIMLSIDTASNGYDGPDPNSNS